MAESGSGSQAAQHRDSGASWRLRDQQGAEGLDRCRGPVPARQLASVVRRRDRDAAGTHIHVSQPPAQAPGHWPLRRARAHDP